MRRSFKVSAFLSFVIASGCSSSSSGPVGQPISPQLESMESAGPWVNGRWQLVGEASSFGDFGADIQNISIKPNEIIFDIDGHVAAESPMANSPDFGGDCHFRVRSTHFGLQQRVNDLVDLVAQDRRYELLDSPGNRRDCERQMGRLNSFMRGNDGYVVFANFQRIDDNTFRAEPRRPHTDGEFKVYRRKMRR